MDMPGRGLYDERDSGIARSGRLIRLGAKAWIDLHSTQPSALQLSFGLGLYLFLSRSKRSRNREDRVCTTKLLLHLRKVASPSFHLRHIVGSQKYFQTVVLIVWIAKNKSDAANEFIFFKALPV